MKRPICTRAGPVIVVSVLISAIGCGSDVRTGVPASQGITPADPVTSSAPSPAVSAGAGWPSTIDGETLSFRSIGVALAFLKRNMIMPIGLPKGLPRDIRLAPRPLYVQTIDGQRSAQLHLLFGKRGHLYVQWGVSELDGCAPEDSVTVMVAGQPGRLREAGDGRWTELIWPASLERPYGSLGLAGSFTKDQVLAMARSMNPVQAPIVTDVGC